MWRGRVEPDTTAGEDRRSARRRWVASTLLAVGVHEADAERGLASEIAGRCSRAVGWSAAGAEILLALGGSRPIAVDLEACAPRRDLAGLLNRYFAPAERAWIWSARDREAAFAAGWACKEAALKLLRRGLRCDPARIEIGAPGDTHDSRSVQLDGRRVEARVYPLLAGAGHAAALAIALAPVADLDNNR